MDVFCFKMSTKHHEALHHPPNKELCQGMKEICFVVAGYLQQGFSITTYNEVIRNIHHHDKIYINISSWE